MGLSRVMAVLAIAVTGLTGCLAIAPKSETGAAPAEPSPAAVNAPGHAGDSKPARSGPGLFESKSGYALSTGLNEYAEGEYAAAAKDLQSALDLGLSSSDQIKAHKHLAFIHCVTGKKRQCRDEFLKALAINPSLNLEPAEAGHPIWGPVFKSAKAASAKKASPKKK